MRHEVRLADIGEGLEEAEIIRWLVAVGDHVRRDQPLIEVMTDKSNAELPAPEAGVIVELGGAEGDLLSVGALIAVIEETAQPITAVQPAPTETPAAAPATPPSPTPAVKPHGDVAANEQVLDVPAPPSSQPASRPKASPSTRREAADRGIDLSVIQGTGPGGRILLSDLDSSHTSPPVPTPTTDTPPPLLAQADDPADEAPVDNSAPRALAAEVVPLRGVRRVVAKNMTQSWSEIPHIHAFEQIDAAPLLELRRQIRMNGGGSYEHVTPLTFFVAAVARTLAHHPQANASLSMTDESISYHGSVNVGVAVAAEQGLVVPVLQGADRLDFETLAVTLAELVRGARDGALPREHFMGGTVTISNFGSLGGEQAMPLIRPPESVIVGFGSIAQRPFVIDGDVVARPTMHTVVGADHRLLDGDITTAVLTMIGSLLTDPLQLVL